MIKGVIAGIISTAICALLGWLWFAFFSDVFLEDPKAFVLFGIITFVAGAVIGIALGKSSSIVRDHIDKRTLHAEYMQMLSGKMVELPSSYKRLLAMLYVTQQIEDSHDGDFNWLIMDAMEPGEIEEQNLFYKDLTFSYELPNGNWVFELKPDTRKIMRRNKKIYKPFIDEVKSGETASLIAELRELNNRLKKIRDL